MGSQAPDKKKKKKKKDKSEKKDKKDKKLKVKELYEDDADLGASAEGLEGAANQTKDLGADLGRARALAQDDDDDEDIDNIIM